MSTFLDERPKPVRSLSRFLTFALIVIIAISGLTARLFYLQIVDGGRLATLAVHNRTVLEPIQSPRGLIYDRNGRPLVTNVPTFVVKLRPSDLTLDQRPVVVDRLSALLGMPAADINATIDGNPGSTFDLVRIAGDVDEPTARLISEAGAGPARRRGRRRGTDVTYTDGPLMSQLLGYSAPISGDQLATLKAQGLPARRPDRQGRRRSEIRDPAARHVRQPERRTGRLGTADPGPADRHPAAAGRLPAR